MREMCVRRWGALAVVVPVIAWVPMVAWGQSGTGLYGEYYNTADLTGNVSATVTEAVSRVYVDAATGVTNAFPAPLDATNNSVRWQGLVEAPASGAFIFMPNVAPNHDDGMRVWIDGRLVYDRWRGQGAGGAITAGRTVNLSANQRVPIRVEYYQGGGDASVRLYWTYPGQAAQIVPLNRLYPIVATPKITPGTGSYSSAQLVTITCDHVGATIHYTTDGSTPTTSSPVYGGPFVVTATTTVRALAVKAGMTNSGVASQTLTISDTGPPVLSRVFAPQSATRVLVVYSEPVDPATATNIANYSLSGGLLISGASLDADARTVVLTTTAMVDGTNYTITVNNVQDLAGLTIVPGTQRVFTFQSMATNLVHYWRFDEGSGVLSADDAGAASVTNITGTGSVWGQGRYLRAVDLNGVNNTLQLAADIRNDVDDDFTIAAWVLTEQQAQAKSGWNSPSLLGQDNGNEQNEIFHAYVGDGGFFRITIPTPGSTTGAGAWVSSVSTTNVGSTLAWTHVATQRVASSGTTRVFVNGVQQDQDAGSTTTANLLGVNSNLNRLGCQVNRGGGVIGQSHWLGAIDELRIYNAAISAGELYHLVNEPPDVNAGPDATASITTPHQLTATVTDNTMPPGGSLTYSWSQVSGPGTATFSNPSVEDPTVTFSLGGTYVLRLTASDGSLASSDDVQIIVSRISVTPLTLTTVEGGSPQSFSVVLTAPPSADVTFSVTSGDPSEGTVSATSLTFTTGNWNTPQVVNVTPIDDSVADGNITYTIVLGTTSSSDPAFNGIDVPDVQVTNNDNDIPGITVSTGSVTVSEGGVPATFTVVLNTQPAANVTFNVNSSDTTEATVSPPSLTFDGTNWNIPQQVTVTPVDDTILDFTQYYTILLGIATSADANYNGLDPADVAGATIDNEVIPEAEGAWGNCGATGAEGLLGLLAVALWRRRGRRA